MLHHFPFYSSKLSAFRVKYLGFDYTVKSINLHAQNSKKTTLTVESYNTIYAYCISGTNITVFHDLLAVSLSYVLFWIK